jgi:hypothetical protein
MGSGAGHRRPAVPMTAPTSRVRGGSTRSPGDGPVRGTPAQEECALRSVDAPTLGTRARTRPLVRGSRRAALGRPGRRRAAPGRMSRPELWAGDAPERPRPMPVHGAPPTDTRLTQMPWSGRAPGTEAGALGAGCARSASWTTASTNAHAHPDEHPSSLPAGRATASTRREEFVTIAGASVGSIHRCVRARAHAQRGVAGRQHRATRAESVLRRTARPGNDTSPVALHAWLP